jgi:hypothetical protein
MSQYIDGFVLSIPKDKLAAYKRMEQQPNDKRSGRSAAIAALLAAGAGAGFGWIIWLTTGNNGVAIGLAGPIALLVNSMLRKVIK